MDVSVIIPLGPAEQALPVLFARLHLLSPQWEVIVALCPANAQLVDTLGGAGLRDVKVVIAPQGRARQMNLAAQQAAGRHLWFLHADSRLTPEAVLALQQSLRRWPHRLLYFRLRFAADGRGPMALNALGANLRADWLQVPFGDQALCLPRELFERLGGYPEDVAYGEDHLLVWRVRLAGVELASTGCVLETSAVKYRQQGWWRLTLLYQWRWLRQASPYALRLLAQRLSLWRSPRRQR